MDLTSVNSTEQTGKSEQTYEIELELQPDCILAFLQSAESGEGEAWLSSLAETLWWGAEPCGVGRLAGLTVDDSMPMALVPSEPVPPQTADRLVALCRSLYSDSSASSAALGAFPCAHQTGLNRCHLREVHDEAPHAPNYFISARVCGGRYYLLLQGEPSSSLGAGSWLLAPDGRGFALQGAPFAHLASVCAGAGPALFEGTLCPPLAPSLRQKGFKAVFIIDDLLAYNGACEFPASTTSTLVAKKPLRAGEQLAAEPFRRRYRKLVSEFVGAYRSRCGHPPTDQPMLMQVKPCFELRPPKGAPAWRYGVAHSSCRSIDF